MKPNSIPSPRPSPVELSLPKAEQSRRTRMLIIETGIACLSKYGYAQTSMHLIAKEANLSRGPLHYHFADKNELMGAIAEHLPQKISETTLRRLQRAKTIEQKVTTMIEIGLEQHLGDHHLVAIDLLAAARRDPALSAAIMPHIIAGEHAVDEWWGAFGRDLGWSDLKMRAFRTVFVAALRGLALDYTSQTDEKHHRAATAMLKKMLLDFAFKEE